MAKCWDFQETWRGGANPKELSWINMRVPDGDDYVEFMLYSKLPETFGGKNHISLVVPDVAKSVDILKGRPAFKTYGKVAHDRYRGQPEASGEYVRSGRDTCGTDGSEHCDGQAYSAFNGPAHPAPSHD